ncbi:P-loop containing nucleoside triphosphate hydrolase protein [Flagelloscypha sp. PMI_526]|nr:P-loop containing nucleoside triphosphate hydrolase protein [Flagelloscypha sp. PMI_526]
MPVVGERLFVTQKLSLFRSSSSSIDPNTPTWGEKTLLYDNEYVSLQLWERTSSTYDRLTYLAHPGAQVYVLCISIVDALRKCCLDLTFFSLGSVFPEIRHFSPNIPILLVGTKIDLEDDEAALERLRHSHQGPLSCEQGIGLASHLGLMGYLECSALTKEGVREVFEQSVKLAIS